MCSRRAPEKYITGAMAPVGAALDRAANEYSRRGQSTPICACWSLNAPS
jgi:hypothetical protein